MFDFLHRSAPHYPTIREALTQSGLESASDNVGLTVLERHGSYSGRRVNFFRAYSPVNASQHAVQVHAFGDLDSHQDLVLGSGFVESDGQVVVNPLPEQVRVTPVREPADRTAHTDDERFVFWDAERSHAAEGPLSEPAAVWLKAVSNSGQAARSAPRL